MSSNRTAIAAEIQAALKKHGPMTSAAMAEHIPSADDREIISKVIYQLKTAGVIEKTDEVLGAPGRGAKTVAVWGLAKPITFDTEEEPMPSVHMKFPATSRFDAPGVDYQPATEPPLGGMTGTQRLHDEFMADGAFDTPEVASSIDPTEEALSDLVDQADEAVLALADSLLSDHPVWSRMRALQNDAFQALCDWRLRSHLASDDRSSHADHEIQEMQR